MIQERNIALCIVLSIVTCGIYGIYWFICLSNDTNAAANVDGTSGGVAFLLSVITCNIYGLYWAYKQGEKIDILQQQRDSLSDPVSDHSGCGVGNHAERAEQYGPHVDHIAG